ncbi:hypothetical protein WJX81_007654 [Elliptochloris bilobata]|uniref:Flavin-containing monooxygenase n=1 Tax=Elliptochloris bilobata TaxID=381761 RepID=A0AAW1RYR0_9CHLO
MCSGDRSQHRKSKRVAVVGAGAAGLVVLRELLREGHTATVFEQEERLGGTWVYDGSVPLTNGCKPAKHVHTSMYKHLRTNLPRELMSFTDFPFVQEVMHSVDARRFCGHAEVLAYLEAFAAFYRLRPHIRYGRRVLHALPLWEDATAVDCGPRWRVTTCSAGRADQGVEEAVFDAVLVCNGHYSVPRTPAVAGAAEFPGAQMHSHSYRDARPFAGQTVVVVGASASGEDIGREVADCAGMVYLSARNWHTAPDWDGAWDAPVGRRRNLLRRPELGALLPDGDVTWAHDCPPAAHVDTVIYATGYHYTFDFLEDSGAFTLHDNRVAPLYQHVVPPACPSLALIGLPWKVVPFPQHELQGKWVARVLSGRARLPARPAMEAVAAEHSAQLAARRVPARKAHLLGDAQWAYNDWLAAAAGPDVELLPAWRSEMYDLTGEGKRTAPDSYRDDTAYPPHLLAAVEADMRRQVQVVLAGSA